MACSLFILDKGKPVERPVRKAKGRRIFPAEAWLPNGCERFSSASDGEEVLYLPSWGLDGEPQAASVRRIPVFRPKDPE
jgi:hypothetical protein